MPVSNRHKDYKKFAPKWKKCRDLIDGEDALKENREFYLRKNGNQTEEEYLAYLERASLFPATSRTKDGMHGSIFRKQPTKTFPKELEALTSDICLEGTGVYDFAKDIVDEVLSVGRFGTLIDWNDEERRPVCINYLAEDVTNWRVTRVRGKMVLTMLVLREVIVSNAGVADSTGTTAPKKGSKAKIAPNIAKGTGPSTDADDEYSDRNVVQYRAYHLRDDGSGNRYCEMQLWQTQGNGQNEVDVLQETRIPARRGENLDRIPFVFHGPKDEDIECSKPPLYDLVAVNISHYRSSADIEQSAHLTACPTLVLMGFAKTSEKVLLGSATALQTEETEAKAEFLEYTGQGISALAAMLKAKEEQMSAIGARMLEAPKASAETAQTLEIRSAAEKSVLAQIADSCSSTTVKCLKWALWWTGTGDDPENIDGINYQLNTDFVSSRMGWQDLKELVSAWQQKAFSKKTLFNNLKKGEIIDEETTFEDEEAQISEGVLELPDGSTVGDLPPGQKATAAPKVKIRKPGTVPGNGNSGTTGDPKPGDPPAPKPE